MFAVKWNCNQNVSLLEQVEKDHLEKFNYSVVLRDDLSTTRYSNKMLNTEYLKYSYKHYLHHTEKRLDQGIAVISPELPALSKHQQQQWQYCLTLSDGLILLHTWAGIHSSQI